MTNYHDTAADLRTLADLLDLNANDLPVRQYANVPLTISIGVPERGDVVQAAETLGVGVKDSRGTHAYATVRVDTVSLEFCHVSDAAMAEHRTRMAYAATMPVSA